LKLYASVWERKDNGEMVLTKDGKVVIIKEPSPTLLRLLGNELDGTIFLWIQHGTSRSLADAQNLIHQQVMTQMNGDRAYLRQELHGRKSRMTLIMMYPGSLQIFLSCGKRCLITGEG